jgi:dihydrofolate reductase
MSRITVVNHLSLDGVMQAPARADEDERGGFAHGGWAQAGNDAVMGRAMGERMGGDGALLLGRRTYEDFARYWPQRTDNPYTEVLNATRKYVATRTLTEPAWENTTLLSGADAADAVATLKHESRVALTILGSGDLIRSLLPHGLIDVWVLMIHPRVLGAGQRLFPAGGPEAKLRLRETVTTTTGVIIATYDSAADG